MAVPGRLQGKVAIVTGGARGLGRGIASVLAREGANIAVADLAVEEAQDTLTASRTRARRSDAFGRRLRAWVALMCS